MGRSGARRPVASALLVLTLWMPAACALGGGEPAGEGRSASASSAEAAADLEGIVRMWSSSATGYLDVMPGVILVVSQDGLVRERALGDAQLEPQRPMQVGDRFGIGSVTKPMVAAIILQLAEEGALALDDTIT